MRLLDGIISFLFSVIMLLVAIILVLVGTGTINPQMILDTLGEYVFNPEVLTSRIFNPVTIAGIVLFLAALKTTIFHSFFKDKRKTSIKVKTKNGEVEIAQDTIINIAKNATLSFDNVKEVQAKMYKKCKSVVIDESIQVYSDTNIRELTDAIQNEVKEKITSTTGVNVTKVSTRIKGISNSKKKETLDNKNTEYVTAKQPVSVTTNSEVFNVDAAVEKMADVKETAEIVEDINKEVKAGDTEVTKDE